jgi:Fic family protein
MRRDEFGDVFPGRLVTDPRGHLAFVPNPLPPTIALERSTINLLAEAHGALGELKGVGRGLPNPLLLTTPFLSREAVLSSRIEGTTAGLQDVLLYDVDPVRSPELADVREVSNYIAALELGFSLLDSLPICLRLIQQVHARLMEGVRGQYQRPGEFRDRPNMIGVRGERPETARFVPPPAMEMQQALHDLERFMGERNHEIPFLIELSLVHYQFETIHPFMDGNGRIGRLLIALQLRDRAYLPQPLLYLSAYFERNRDAYKDHLLEVSRHGSWTAWIDFFLKGVAEQASDTVQRSYHLLDLRDEYRNWALGRHRTGNVAKLIDLVFERPVLTVPIVEKWLEVTPRTANQLVQKLVEESILIEVTGRSRHRRFVAVDVLSIVSPPDE